VCEAARALVELGVSSLDHLDLSAAQQRHVVDDLALRIETIPTSRRFSA